jgi:hypothetical protein
MDVPGDLDTTAKAVYLYQRATSQLHRCGSTCWAKPSQEFVHSLSLPGELARKGVNRTFCVVNRMAQKGTHRSDAQSTSDLFGETYFGPFQRSW